MVGWKWRRKGLKSLNTRREMVRPRQPLAHRIEPITWDAVSQGRPVDRAFRLGDRLGPPDRERSAGMFVTGWAAGAIHAGSMRNFKNPPGARPKDVSFRPGGAGSEAALGEVR